MDSNKGQKTKYFVDTEFHEHSYNIITSGKDQLVNTLDLISIGIVREDGKSYYAVSSEFNVNKAFSNKWLVENVLKNIFEEIKFHEKAEFNLQDFSLSINCGHITGLAKSNNQIKEEIIAFIGEDEPEFWAYYADYDWVVFCWLFGRMVDLPKNFPMYCKDLKQVLDVSNISKEWVKENVPQKNEHNALEDAKWNKKLFDTLLEKVMYIPL